jgi:DNA polymerase III subunit gamma/tau
MSQALYRKWRPQNWQAVVGQDHVVQTLRNALAANRVAHAYLFAGPRGTGKTTTARLLAKAVNCLDADLTERPCNHCDYCQAVNQGRFLDLIEIDAASNTSVDDVRDLREKIGFSPNQGRYKVYIIDEVHMLSTAAFNALLKTLEEPPSHAIFVLATTEVHKIPATVTSRCQRHEFRRIPSAEIAAYLSQIAEQESIPTDPQAINLIARHSTGAMRDAISLLDQLASGGEPLSADKVRAVLGISTNQAVIDIVQALINRQPALGLNAVHAALDAGSDPRQFARQIVDYLRDLLLSLTGSADQIDETAEVLEQMLRQAQALGSSELLRLIRAFNNAASEGRSAWQPALPLELAIIESLAESQPVVSMQTGPILPPTPAQAKNAPAPQAKTASVAQPVPKASAVGENLLKPAPPAAALRQAQPAAPDAESSSSGDEALRQVQEGWKKIVGQVRESNPGTQPLLSSSQPVAVRGGVLYLGCNGEFVKNKLETGNHLEVIRKAILRVLGFELPICCYVASGGSGSLPPDLDGDGMVAHALRDLGGEIVDIQ